MSYTTYFIEFTYLAAGILFILGLKGLSHPVSAKRGMHHLDLRALECVVTVSGGKLRGSIAPNCASPTYCNSCAAASSANW